MIKTDKGTIFNFLIKGKIFTLSPLEIAYLDHIVEKFDESSAKRVKDIESVTNHDVKSVEYYIKEKLELSKFFKKIQSLMMSKNMSIFAVLQKT